MRARNVLFTLVLLLIIFLVAIYKRHQERDLREAFQRAPKRLYFYAFARCRMRCLSLTDADITTVMQKGVININQSRRAVRPCPVYAVQARVHQRYVRVLFEQCRNGSFVMNCYNLESADTCSCPDTYQPKPR